MTVLAYLLVGACFCTWAYVERCERKDREAWWRSWDQSPAWRVVRDLYDWSEDGL